MGDYLQTTKSYVQLAGKSDTRLSYPQWKGSTRKECEAQESSAGRRTDFMTVGRILGIYQLL